jgi:dipeptidyl aminopeptidase/acylaminoacyl peptidase
MKWSIAGINPVGLLAVVSISALAQTNYLTPADNLVVEGVPKIPVELADQIGRYTEFRSASFSSWHPQRREMLIVTRFADTPQVHRVEFPAGARTQLTFFKDRALNPTYQPVSGEYFIFTKDSGGDENFQKYRFDVATGETTLLTDGKSRNTGGIWSTKGDRFIFGSTRRNGQDVDLWIVDPLDPKSARMLAELKGGGWGALDVSPDDRRVLAIEVISINESYLWSIDIASGERTLLTPKAAGEPIRYDGAKFSRDGKGVYLTTDRDSEFLRLCYLDLATGRTNSLTEHINWDVVYFDLSRDGKQIAFIVNEDGLNVLHLWDVGRRKEAKVPKLPGAVGGLEWHRNNRDLGLTLDSARRTADAYSLDVKSGEFKRWTASETAGLNTAEFTEPELIRWKSFDQLSISGWLYKPPAKFSGKRPVIIQIHGGPESQAQVSFQGPNNYAINELGIALIQPNIRGSSGYGKTFLKLDNGKLRENAYKDIGALLDWIKTRPDLDADRVMVTGGSYGGHMTLAVATFYPGRIRCALDIVGISSLVTFLENTSAYRRDLRRVEYGDERDPAMREFLNRVAPLNNAARISKPLFVVQGGNDPRVPLSEAVQIVQTLKEKGTPVWYLMAKDEGHGFAKKKNRDFQLYSTVLFVKTYLVDQAPLP